MKIEMVLPALDAAGMEMVTIRLTRKLTMRGHDVGITCIEREGALAAELRRQGHKISVVPSPGWLSNIYPEALTSWFRELKPDVVHVHNSGWLKVAKAARAAGVARVVHTLHGLLDHEPTYAPLLKRWAARFTDVTIAVSEPLRRHLLNKAGLPPTSVWTVPNGIDTDTFSPGPRALRLREALGLSSDALLVGHVARFAPVKNHALLLEAFERVRCNAPEAVLLLIGDGPLRGRIEAQIDQLGLWSHVRLLGELHENVPGLYRELDVFVLCSDAEGTSMSILEAMASGLPIIATSVGGSPDLLSSGSCGVLVPPREPELLAQMILSLLGNQPERSSLGAQARRRALSIYAEDKIVSLHEALYSGRDMPPVNLGVPQEATSCAG